MNTLIQDLENAAFNEVHNFINSLPEYIWEDKELFDGTILDRAKGVIRKSLDKMDIQEVNNYTIECQIRNPTQYCIARTHSANSQELPQDTLCYILFDTLDVSWEKFKEWKENR